VKRSSLDITEVEPHSPPIRLGSQTEWLIVCSWWSQAWSQTHLASPGKSIQIDRRFTRYRMSFVAWMTLPTLCL
jgi:hypothetical protein